MPTFDAGLDQLNYDFTAVGGAAGVIPEPSTEQIETFVEMLREVMPTKDGPDGSVSIDFAVLTTRVEEGEDLELLLNTAVSDLCSGTPSVPEIAALPFRVKQRFYGWIVGTFFHPEA